MDNSVENKIILYYNKGWTKALWREVTGQYEVPNGVGLAAYELGQDDQEGGRLRTDNEITNKLIKK